MDISPQAKEKLLSAFHHLRDLVAWEHDCGSHDCTIDTPMCEVRQAEAARRDIMAVLDPPMDTLQPERLVSLPERIFVEEWRRENTRHNGPLSGGRTLEHILSHEKTHHPLAGPQPKLDYVTLRDAQVATSVIQWLGTNCGQSFLWVVNQRINKEREENREVPGGSIHRSDVIIKERDIFTVLEDRLLADILPTPYNAEKFRMGKDLAVHLRREIKYALGVAMTLFAVETGYASMSEGAKTIYMNEEKFKKFHDKARKAIKKRVANMREATLKTKGE
jgi:hypothetical protein